MVDGVVVGAKARHARRLVGELLLEGRVLPGRKGLEVIELAGAIAGERLVHVVDDETGHLLDDHPVRTPVHRVPDPGVVLVQHHLLEHVGAVRHQAAGRRPVRAVGLDGRPVGGKQGGVGRHCRKVRQRGRQLHLEGAVVDRPHPEVGGRLLSGEDLLRVHHLGELEIPPVGRGGRGVDGPPPGIDEVTRGHRVAVRPSRVLAEVEGVGGIALRGGIAGRHPGYEAAVRVLAEETLEEVADDVEPGDVLVELRVEGRELVQQPVGEGLVVGERLPGLGVGSGGKHGRGCARGGDEREDQHQRQGGHRRSQREDGLRALLLDRHGSLPFGLWTRHRDPAMPATPAGAGRRPGKASLRKLKSQIK